jgi:hypothetical protein
MFPSYAEAQREIEQQAAIERLETRIALNRAARDFHEQERRDPELINAAFPHWIPPLP